MADSKPGASWVSALGVVLGALGLVPWVLDMAGVNTSGALVPFLPTLLDIWRVASPFALFVGGALVGWFVRDRQKSREAYAAAEINQMKLDREAEIEQMKLDRAAERKRLKAENEARMRAAEKELERRLEREDAESAERMRREREERERAEAERVEREQEAERQLRWERRMIRKFKEGDPGMKRKIAEMFENGRVEMREDNLGYLNLHDWVEYDTIGTNWPDYHVIISAYLTDDAKSLLERNRELLEFECGE